MGTGNTKAKILNQLKNIYEYMTFSLIKIIFLVVSWIFLTIQHFYLYYVQSGSLEFYCFKNLGLCTAYLATDQFIIHV